MRNVFIAKKIMQLIIRTEEDLKALQGKFVLQISDKEPNKTLMDFDWHFVKEKKD